ncbi:MAG: hypothetical protein GX055_04245 [Desulfovibrionales bacterium]|nr:hypothetical protein [Desulfovibrionales bacterium]
MLSVLFFSLVMMIFSAAGVWIVVSRLPEDYFVHPCQRPVRASRIDTILVVLKNICGFVVFLSGVAMLFLPGQGLLTMLIGVLLMDFPGKYRLERALIARAAVRNALNWMRMRWGRAPFCWGSESAQSCYVKK